jgi:hypothetical protein
LRGAQFKIGWLLTERTALENSSSAEALMSCTKRLRHAQHHGDDPLRCATDGGATLPGKGRAANACRPSRDARRQSRLDARAR